MIVTALGISDLASCTQVCKQWRAAVICCSEQRLQCCDYKKIFPLLLRINGVGDVIGWYAKAIAQEKHGIVLLRMGFAKDYSQRIQEYVFNAVQEFEQALTAAWDVPVKYESMSDKLYVCTEKHRFIITPHHITCNLIGGTRPATFHRDSGWYTMIYDMYLFESGVPYPPELFAEKTFAFLSLYKNFKM